MPDSIQLNVNGSARAVTVEPDTPLLYILRNDFELNGRRMRDLPFSPQRVKAALA